MDDRERVSRSGDGKSEPDRGLGWAFMKRYEYLLIYVAIVVTISLVVAFLDGY